MKRKFKDIQSIEALREYLDAPFSNGSWSSAYHYTTLETLFHIFKNKRLKVSQMKKMNDILEYKFADSCKDYFCCLSQGRSDNKENFGMWAMYGHIKGNSNPRNVEQIEPREIGVKIEIPKNMLRKIINYDPNINLHFVAYTNLISFLRNSNNKNNIIRKGEKVRFGYNATGQEIEINKQLYGYLKDNSWSYEKELRLRLPEKKAKNDNKYQIQGCDAFILVTNDFLKELRIYPSPLYTVEECRNIFNNLKGNEIILDPVFLDNPYYNLFQ